MATPTYDLLDSVTLSSSSSSVTFSSIDQSYRDLVLVGEHLGSGGIASFYVTLNGDTGSNYSMVWMSGTGSTSSGSTTTTQFSGLSATTTVATLNIFNIMDYSATDKHKSVLTRSNTPTFVQARAQRWANTSAVTSMTIDGQNNPFASGSTFYLYGVAS